MKLEVLMSCMNQNNFNLTENMNLTTDILIINQTNENKYDERIVNGNKQRMISNTQRGISKSRNELLLNMNGDIGILCDDDVIYEKDYEKTILKAFEELKDADVIIFNTNSIGRPEKNITKLKKAFPHKYYTSTRITFKKESLLKNNLFFNVNFGAGSIYSSGEESLLLRNCYDKKLKVYEYPYVIATVNQSNSTWFTGYDEKFFYDKGAWIKEAYPKTWFIFMWYFVLRLYNKSNLTLFQILKYLCYGVKSYRTSISYNEFLRIKR